MKLSRSLLSFLSCAFLLLVSGAACAAGQADQISVENPYVRLAPPGMRTTSAYLTVKNAGSKDAVIVKAESSVAKRTELHNHINVNDVMRMRQMKEVIVPAKGSAQFAPGGMHVMLIDLKSPLREGDHVVITFGFADGSSKEFHALTQRGDAAADNAQHAH